MLNRLNWIQLKLAKAVWEEGLLIVMYEPVDDDGQNIVSTEQSQKDIVIVNFPRLISSFLEDTG